MYLLVLVLEKPLDGLVGPEKLMVCIKTGATELELDNRLVPLRQNKPKSAEA